MSALGGFSPTTAVLDELQRYGSVTVDLASGNSIAVVQVICVEDGRSVTYYQQHVKEERYERALKALADVAKDLARNYVRALVPGKERGKRWYHLLASAVQDGSDPRAHAVGRLQRTHKTRGPLLPPLQAQRNKRRARIQAYV